MYYAMINILASLNRVALPDIEFLVCLPVFMYFSIGENLFSYHLCVFLVLVSWYMCRTHVCANTFYQRVVEILYLQAIEIIMYTISSKVNIDNVQIYPTSLALVVLLFNLSNSWFLMNMKGSLHRTCRTDSY